MQKRGGAIAHREVEKIKKYEPATNKLRRTGFVPAVFDSYGGIGEQWAAHLKLLVRYSFENCLIDYPNEWVASLVDNCSCVIVKANANICYEYFELVADLLSNNRSAHHRTPSRKVDNQEDMTPSRRRKMTKAFSAISTPVTNKIVSNQAAVLSQPTAHRHSVSTNKVARRLFG